MRFCILGKANNANRCGATVWFEYTHISFTAQGATKANCHAPCPSDLV